MTQRKTTAARVGELWDCLYAMIRGGEAPARVQEFYTKGIANVFGEPVVTLGETLEEAPARHVDYKPAYLLDEPMVKVPDDFIGDSIGK